MPNMTLLQNIRPRHLLTPLVESLCKEVLGVPAIDFNTQEKVTELVTNYERQHSFFQTAEANAKRVLSPALDELVSWIRKNEDSLGKARRQIFKLLVFSHSLRFIIICAILKLRTAPLRAC